MNHHLKGTPAGEVGKELNSKLSHRRLAGGGQVRQQTKRGARPVDVDEVFDFIETQIEDYLDRLRHDDVIAAPDLQGRSKKAKSKAGGQIDYQAQRDGRMTFKEFQRCMFDAGISWLNADEMRGKFDAMDIDGSGKLNLAEVFSAATRMQHLVEQAREYERTQVALGRKMTQLEVMEEFSMELLTGDDLGKRPDVKVTVSSGSSSEFVHIECKDAWSPDAGDEERWIEWDFGTGMMITAVATCGHPLRDNDNAKYELQFYEECRKDSGEDSKLGPDPVTFSEMKEHLKLIAEFKEKSTEDWLDYWNDVLEEDPDGKWEPYKFGGGERSEFHCQHLERNCPDENLLDPPREASQGRVRLKVNEMDEEAGLRATLYGYHQERPDEVVQVGTGEVPVPSRPVSKPPKSSRAGSKTMSILGAAPAN